MEDGLRLLGFTLAHCLFVTLASAAFAAEPLPAPRGPVLLRITGNITTMNAEGAAEFDRDMLDSLGRHEMRTTTVWTDGPKLFGGVLMRDVLARVGARGRSVEAHALNDYVIEIPLDDFDRYDVLIATTMDGRELLARDKGPLWIVYPRDTAEELKDSRYDHRWIWQLDRLEVR